MKQCCLLVDFENVQRMDLSVLDDGFSVMIFVGHGQKTIPFDLVQGAQRFGERLQWVKIDGTGRNALDFHIACYLGRLYSQSPGTHAIVLSKDSGFDPLIRHLNKQGNSCKRINCLSEVWPSLPLEPEPNYKRAVELLAKSKKTGRPKTKAALTQQVSSMCQKQLGDAEVSDLVAQLFADGKVAEMDGGLTYHL